MGIDFGRIYLRKENKETEKMTKNNWKKRAMQLLLMVVCSVMLLGIPAQAASSKSIYKQAVTYYKKGSYKKAQKLFSRLSADANEKCVSKMSSAMKKAYRNIVKKYRVNTTLGSSTPYLWGYYLTDIDNDKKPELVVEYGTCEADVRTRIYTYKNGKAKKVGQFYSGHTSFYYYPSGKGMVLFSAHMGYESVKVLTLKNGKIQMTAWSSGRQVKTAEDYIELPYALDGHIRYDSNYNTTVDYSPLE
jgi:hypothetical protein